MAFESVVAESDGGATDSAARVSASNCHGLRYLAFISTPSFISDSRIGTIGLAAKRERETAEATQIEEDDEEWKGGRCETERQGRSECRCGHPPEAETKR